jgi:hypothetical protein
MPFLPWDHEIPCFGESRIEYARLVAVKITCTMNERYTLQEIQEAAARGQCHTWRLRTTPWVSASHNLDSEAWRPAYVFDPRHGLDAFRYFAAPEDLATWERALNDYGFEEEEVDAPLMERVLQIRELARKLGGADIARPCKTALPFLW